MATIKGIEDLTGMDLQLELQRGGKFIVYQYVISVVLMTFQRGSNVYFIRANENPVMKGLPFTLITLLFGWWGIPWGPIRSIGSLAVNLRGGRDVTAEILAAMRASSRTPTTDE